MTASQDGRDMFGRDGSALFVESGTDALVGAMRALGSRSVALPTYTCGSLALACRMAGCRFVVVDIDQDLQIDLRLVRGLWEDGKIDTVIVPHMFGIQVELADFRKSTRGLKVIEDCSQCVGLDGLGKHSDVTVLSTGKSKWLNYGHGGLIVGIDRPAGYAGRIPDGLLELIDRVPERLAKRQEFADELHAAGVALVGYDRPNAWLRAMYRTSGPARRQAYAPLHRTEGFCCPNADMNDGTIDWISIKVT